MLLNLINEMLIDYDGVSRDTMEELLRYLERDNATEEERQVCRLVRSNVKSANGRWYITEYLELINE
jgi:hypothetical protein